MNKVLIDTDILSFYFKKMPSVVEKFDNYINRFGKINISRPTVIEVVSGLKAKNATKQLAEFREFIAKHTILEIDEKSSEITAEYISFLLQNGKHSGTFDVLIAGIAKVNDLTLITNNTKDYQNFSGLQLDNWKD